MIEVVEVPQGTSIDFSRVATRQLRQQLKRDRIAFEENGGRGVDLAERIDCAEYELRQRAFSAAVKMRKKGLQ
jgi:hypothetical protein